MAELKPAYLIHGDDHGAVAERRAGLKALAAKFKGQAPAPEMHYIILERVGSAVSGEQVLKYQKWLAKVSYSFDQLSKEK